MILVTGANGLVGSFVCAHLTQKGHKVRALVRKNSDTSLLKNLSGGLDIFTGDVSDTGSLLDAISGVEYVVHTAAIISFWNKRNTEMYQTNVIGTRNLVDVCLEHNIKKFIHVSSIAAVGRKTTDTHISETNTWEDSSLNSYYAESKHQAEVEVYRGMEEGLTATIVNPSIILGPGLNSSISGRLFKYVAGQHKFYTDGYLNYVDVRDVADAIEKLLFDADSNGERYILNGGITSYKDFFAQVAGTLQVAAPSVRATNFMRQVVWRIEAVKSFFTGKEPLITKTTAKTAANKIEYSSAKIIKATQISFRPLSDTIEWTCSKLFH
ncbi:MAG: SDR family oxidoreductase [Cytophaga sp.]|uniref:SDR family oxidoreductase n=1 Tax=Cytophaga sp. TaxID=29535 RepID=UPI003F7FC21E